MTLPHPGSRTGADAPEGRDDAAGRSRTDGVAGREATDAGERPGAAVAEEDVADDVAGGDSPDDVADGEANDASGGADCTADDDPLVSVVLPTLGRRPGMLREAVGSVARQTYDPVELVVVDDSPEGVSRDLEADPPAGLAVRAVRDGDHNGAGDARNTGLRVADGPLVAFIDDDDTWLSGKLARQVAALRAGGPAVGAVYTGLAHVRDGEVLGVRRATVDGDVTRDVFAGRSLAVFSTLLVRAAVVPAAGPIDPRFPYLEDREWCLRLSRHCEFAAVPDPLVRYRHGDYEQLTDDYEALRNVAYPLFVEKHRPTAAEYGAAWERRLVAALSRNVAGAALDAGRYRDALRFALRSLRYDPVRGRAAAQVLAAVGGPLTHRPLRALRRAVRRSRSSGVGDGQPARPPGDPDGRDATGTDERPARTGGRRG